MAMTMTASAAVNYSEVDMFLPGGRAVVYYYRSFDPVASRRLYTEDGQLLGPEEKVIITFSSAPED